VPLPPPLPELVPPLLVVPPLPLLLPPLLVEPLEPPLEDPPLELPPRSPGSGSATAPLDCSAQPYPTMIATMESPKKRIPNLAPGN
jgi:hypothetical protein